MLTKKKAKEVKIKVDESNFEKVVKKLLARLGRTPEAIAENLLAEGCKEDKNNFYCPLKVYLMKKTNLKRFEVYGDGSIWLPDNDGYTAAEVNLSKAGCDFVCRFDYGHFPELATH